MARIRSIKPEFWTDEKIMPLPYEARLFFIGMWNFADDEGFLWDEPVRLRSQILPNDQVDAAALIAMLIQNKRLELYVTADGKRALKIAHFLEHQRVAHPARSKISPVVTKAQEHSREITKITVKAEEIEDGYLKLREPIADAVIAVEVKTPMLRSDPYQDSELGNPGTAEKPKRPARKPAPDEPLTFQEFYDLYPKTNCSRKEALRSYVRALEKGIPHETIIRGTQQYLGFIAASGSPVAHATTWLNNERWTVDYDAAIAARRLASGGRAPSPHEKLGHAWASAVEKSAERNGN